MKNNETKKERIVQIILELLEHDRYDITTGDILNTVEKHFRVDRRYLQRIIKEMINNNQIGIQKETINKRLYHHILDMPDLNSPEIKEVK